MSNSKEEIIEIVDMLAQNEQALADLFYAYGEKFSSFKLWNILYEEEEKHNDIVLSILDNVEEGSVQFNDMHFSVRTLTTAINQVLEEIAIVEEGGRNLEKAIEFALKIESSMLEKNFLNYFSSKDPEIQKVLDKLRKDTKSHKKMLKTAQSNFLKEKHKNK